MKMATTSGSNSITPTPEEKHDVASDPHNKKESGNSGQVPPTWTEAEPGASGMHDQGRARMSRKRETARVLNSVKRFKCAFCPRTFKTVQGKNKHEKTILSGLTCQNCDEKFVRTCERKNHPCTRSKVNVPNQTD